MLVKKQLDNDNQSTTTTTPKQQIYCEINLNSKIIVEITLDNDENVLNYPQALVVKPKSLQTCCQ